MRVHSFEKIRIGIAYMVAYTDGLLKLKVPPSQYAVDHYHMTLLRDRLFLEDITVGDLYPLQT